MIPAKNSFLSEDFELIEQPTKTYKLHLTDNVVSGFADEREAIAQAIYKILNTERYLYVMYSHNYGIELNDLFGEPVSYACPMLVPRIKEALMQDIRIQGVDNFSFDTSEKRVVTVSFIAHTVSGDIAVEKVVTI